MSSKNTTTFLARILDVIDSVDINMLVLGPFFLGIVFIIVAAIVSNAIFHGISSPVMNRIIGSIGFFIMSFGGIFQIIKKELIGPFKKSKLSAFLAVLNGILIISLTWILAIILPLMSILGQ
jgi:hypothetical protein